ncbi:MAG: 3-deoxy-D-manno-octulosonic acid transferase, partial [Lentisphaeria bacterium]|nr:3-deoxy-D-manno-octulosonic acid transferase [Lentisphaeria bacterium]
IRPSKLVIFETELWPQLISSAKRSGAKLMLANTRISDHSFRGYRRFRFVIAPMLRKFDRICAQTELDRERLLAIAPGIETRVSVCGNIKFDQAPPAGDGADFPALFGEQGITVLLAASTHSPEEPLILDAFLALRKEFPALRLVLVPRHAERGNDIEKMIRDRNLSYHRRSNDTGDKQGFAVLLADTTGELARLIKGADLVIMGKTLAGNDEGQNIIEPAVMGKPVVCGRQLKNFRQALDALVKGDAVLRVMKDDELVGALRSLLADPVKRRELGERARAVMLKSRGALEKILAEIIK